MQNINNTAQIATGTSGNTDERKQESKHWMENLNAMEIKTQAESLARYVGVLNPHTVVRTWLNMALDAYPNEQKAKLSIVILALMGLCDDGFDVAQCGKLGEIADVAMRMLYAEPYDHLERLMQNFECNL